METIIRTKEQDLAKFNETVQILVKAFLNDTLMHGHPCACFIGNLIAPKIGCEVKVLDTDNTRATWITKDGNVVCGFDWFQTLYPKRLRTYYNSDRGYAHLYSTGYTIEEVMRLEQAFENVEKLPDGSVNHNIDPSGYKGMMAVLDVLAEIHHIDLSVKEEAKLLFVKI